MRTVVLNTVGSLGDLHPFIALALELRRLDIRPIVASFGEYQGKVESEGLEFRALRPALSEVFAELGMDWAEVTQRVIESDEFLFRQVLFPHLRVAYENALLVQRDADLVLPSSVAFGARLAAEKAGIAWIAIVLQPLMFMSAYDPSMIPHPLWLGPLLRRLGPRIARATFNLGKRTRLRSITRPVRELRAAIGLPAGGDDPVFDGQFAPPGAIGLYSPLLGKPQPDYPVPSEVVGFAYYDSEKGGHSALDAELERFLAEGPAPIVVTLGSMAVNYPGAGKFYRDSLAAARRAGRRAVLLVGERVDPVLQTDGGGDFLLRPYVPHSLIFPRAAVVVHQGGVGTLGQAMRAGRPQLVVPFYADQFDNAARAARLGIARWVHFRRYGEAVAAWAFAALLQDSSYEARAGEVAAEVGARNGAARAAELVRRFLEAGTMATVSGRGAPRSPVV